MTSTLELREVSVVRDSTSAVEAVDLDVPSGEITALLGSNGAGKSSLVLACAGVVPCTGSIRLDGAELSRLPPQKRRGAGLAAVPEGHRLLRSMTVAENLAVAASLFSKAESRRRVGSVLEIFPELARMLDRRSSSLSGGEQQMLAIGQALLVSPRALLVDELSLGLAPVIVDRLLAILRDLAANGTAVLLIEQSAPKALAVATTAHVMAAGSIVLSAPAVDLRDDVDQLTHAYLGVV